MSLEVWLSSLPCVTNVTNDYPNKINDKSSNVNLPMGVTDVISKNVSNATETDGTAYIDIALHPKPKPLLACTQETSETDELQGLANHEQTNFEYRFNRYIGLGLNQEKAKLLCETLRKRDRENGGDNRRSCFECAHLTNDHGWFCNNWRQAQVAIRARDAQLPTEFAILLQRCDGFKYLD